MIQMHCFQLQSSIKYIAVNGNFKFVLCKIESYSFAQDLQRTKIVFKFDMDI